MSDANETSIGENRLLAMLGRRHYQRLASDMEQVALKKGEVLFEAGEPIRSVYFPLSGLVSIVVPLDGKRVAEVAIVGREGMVGLPVFLGAGRYPHRGIVHAPGSAFRLPAEGFQALARHSTKLSEQLLRYADAFVVQISQSAVCNCLHPLSKRYCRWLLMAHDRVGSDHLPFTQTFLSMMLTVRLASISETTASLQQAGLIRYRRGDLQILDRTGIEGTACDCYRLIQDYFTQLSES